MQKEIVMFLSTTPFTFENTHTIFKLTEAALKKGHQVRLVATADGVFSVAKLSNNVLHLPCCGNRQDQGISAEY